VFLVETDRDAPLERSPGNAKVLEAGPDEVVDHLVEPAPGFDKLRVLFVIFHQLARVRGKPEKVRILLRFCDIRAAFGALVPVKLRFRPESFAGFAVHAAVFAEVDIAFFIQFGKYHLDRFLVRRVRCADELVVADVHQFP